MVRRWMLAFLCAIGVCAAWAPAQAAQTGTVYVITVNGIINPAIADYIGRAVRAAEDADAAALIITMNTPGGLTSSTWQIGEAMLNARVPVVVYVAPQGAGAGSAGVFITYAAHLAAMAPNTNIGAAHPVSGGGEDIGEDLRDKITNDAVARITTWARAHERNAEWAEQAVRNSVSVGSDEALKLNVVNIIATDQADLLRQLDGRTVVLADGSEHTLATSNAPVQPLDMSFVERLLHLLGDPSIATLLISLGTLGIYFEVANPGFGVSGVLGGIAIVLGLYGLSVLPLNMVGLGLLVLAFVLFGVDIFATNHGTLTLGGTIAFVLGALFLIDTSEAPGVAISRGIIAGIALTMGVAASLILLLVARTHKRIDITGDEGLIGQRVPVRATIAPDGMVFVEGALWRARSDDRLDVGETAEIIGVDGLTLIVRQPQHESVITTELYGGMR